MTDTIDEDALLAACTSLGIKRKAAETYWCEAKRHNPPNEGAALAAILRLRAAGWTPTSKPAPKPAPKAAEKPIPEAAEPVQRPMPKVDAVGQDDWWRRNDAKGLKPPKTPTIQNYRMGRLWNWLRSEDKAPLGMALLALLIFFAGVLTGELL